MRAFEQRQAKTYYYAGLISYWNRRKYTTNTQEFLHNSAEATKTLEPVEMNILGTVKDRLLSQMFIQIVEGPEGGGVHKNCPSGSEARKFVLVFSVFSQTMFKWNTDFLLVFGFQFRLLL